MTWAPAALPPRYFMRTLSALRASAPPRLLYARPARRLFLGGVAVQAVGVARIDAGDLHLVGEELQVLRRRRNGAVLGVALDDGHCGQKPSGHRKNEKSGHRMAVEKILFARRWYGV